MDAEDFIYYALIAWIAYKLYEAEENPTLAPINSALGPCTLTNPVSE